MKSFGSLLTISLLTMGASSCNTSQLKSLCILDPVDGYCWVDKEKGEGFKIEDMTCKDVAGETKCWYSIHEDDFNKVLDRLNKCKSKK